MKYYSVLAFFVITASAASINSLTCADLGKTFESICEGLQDKKQPTLDKIGACAAKCTDEACQKNCAGNELVKVIDVNEFRTLQDCVKSNKEDPSGLAQCSKASETASKATLECIKGCKDESCKIYCGAILLNSKRGVDTNPKDKDSNKTKSDSKDEDSTSSTDKTSTSEGTKKTSSSTGEKDSDSKKSKSEDSTSSGSTTKSKDDTKDTTKDTTKSKDDNKDTTKSKDDTKGAKGNSSSGLYAIPSASLLILASSYLLS